MCVCVCVHTHSCTCVCAHAHACMCKHMHIDKNILWYMQEYALVFIFVTVFTVMLCAHVISFDRNHVCFLSCLHVNCPKRGCMDLASCLSVWIGIWFFALPLWTGISFSSCCFFLCVRVNLAQCPCN